MGAGGIRISMRSLPSLKCQTCSMTIPRSGERIRATPPGAEMLSRGNGESALGSNGERGVGRRPAAERPRRHHPDPLTDRAFKGLCFNRCRVRHAQQHAKQQEPAKDAHELKRSGKTAGRRCSTSGLGI